MSDDDLKPADQQNDGGRSSSTRSRHGSLIAWVQLIRLPTVFTVLADVAAAFLLIAGGVEPLSRFAAVLAGGVCLYWAGMILNDVFDLEKDRRERSSRPLASGAIAPQKARIAGWSLLVLGVLLAWTSGYLPNAVGTTSWLPGVIGTLLAGLIVAYDGPLKPTPIAPAAMGGCRVLSFLLGAAPALSVIPGEPIIPRAILGIAFGFGVYVMGITTLARDEATGGHLINLRTGFVVMLLGALLLAFAPGLADAQQRGAWVIRPGGMFVMLIWLIVLPVAVRGFRVQFDPTPAAIGNTIRAGILTIIPLAACFAFLGAGQVAALGIFALLIPSLLLSMKLRVT